MWGKWITGKSCDGKYGNSIKFEMCYDKLERDMEQFICMLTTHPQPIDRLGTWQDEIFIKLEKKILIHLEHAHAYLENL